MQHIDRHLFLLGGSPDIFEAVAEEFIPVADGQNAVIALLLSGESGWEQYVPMYVDFWIKQGISRYEVIVPAQSSDGVRRLDIPAALAILREATGIFIGGGETPIYHHLYATEPIRGLIRERYRQGVPVAGISAGALIVPHICPIPPEDTGESAMRVETGIGLIDDLIVGVHFSEWNALPHVLAAMAQTRTLRGIGIDENACVVLKNGDIDHVLGASAHAITMTNVDNQAHQIRTLE